MPSIQCVVVGFHFNEGNWSKYPKLRDWADHYAVQQPSNPGIDGFSAENGNTKVRVFPLGGLGGLTVGAHQDGGNGAGGDSGPARNHSHVAIASRGGLSFWKIDSEPASAKTIDWLEGGVNAALNASDASPQAVLDAYNGRANGAGKLVPDDPGLTFVFDSHATAYNYLIGSLKPMYHLYDEVRILAVSKNDVP